MKNLLYDINEKPKTLKEWVLYPLQMVSSCIVATILIANICGTPIDACLLGACLGTLTYQLITKGQSPMLISSCGATVSAVIGALAIGTAPNYLAVAIGGIVIAIVYGLLGLLIKIKGQDSFNKLFPPTIIGAITIVIGVNLAGFIPTYVQVNGEQSGIGVAIAIFVMFVVALSSHYFKGFWKTIPFLIGIFAGYIVSLILTISGVISLINIEAFKGISLFKISQLTFMNWNFSELSWATIGKVILLFVPVSLASAMEHCSDHKVLSNIIGTDLTKKPGLHKTLLGDGIASIIGSIVGGLPNTSYGEAIATIGFSRVASTIITTISALILGGLAFIEPVQVFFNSIPSCVFGGCAMILYGYIASSGLKTLLNNKVDLEDNKNLIIVSVILTVGVSGIWIFDNAFSGVSLAIVLGFILNQILHKKI